MTNARRARGVESPRRTPRSFFLDQRKVFEMKKMIFACLALVFAASVLTGCKAEGKIDPDGHVTSSGLVAH